MRRRYTCDLLDSQNEYFQAARNYSNARHDQVVSQARTLAGMGRLVAALNVPRADMPSAQEAGQDRDSFPQDQLCPVEDDIVASLDKIRAEAVKSYLVSKGIDGKLVRTEGRGESQPVATNATSEGRRALTGLLLSSPRAYTRTKGWTG